METKAKRSPVLYILLVLMVLGIAAGVALSALALGGTREALRLMDERIPEQDTETRENDVTIAGNYVILPTTDLSDAYKSGDTSALDDKQKETLDMARAALEEMALTDGMTAFEKERAVYDWMTHSLQRDQGLLTVIPSTQADCDNPYGVLKYHNAVCVGYATTFRMFMEMLDIPCMVVHNTALFHTWDLVRLDGDWYHTDIYSDAGRGNYNNFNMNDALLSSHGQEWDTAFFPAAGSLEYNMANLNAVPGIAPLELPAALRKALDDKTSMLSFRYDGSFTEAEAWKASEAVSQVQQMLWNLSEFNGASVENYTFTRVEDGYLFVITLNFPNDGEEQISEEDREEIQHVVNEVFADITGWTDETEWEVDGDAPIEPVG